MEVKMETFFMGIVSLYFLIKTVYFIINKVDMIEKEIIRFKEWDWIDKDKM
jgi:hypothetical protein|tara:strand:+ start:3663 stop:3815 length:153 start_codon:yes stop_codon:yes gene_type:complete